MVPEPGGVIKISRSADGFCRQIFQNDIDITVLQAVDVDNKGNTILKSFVEECYG